MCHLMWFHQRMKLESKTWHSELVCFWFDVSDETWHVHLCQNAHWFRLMHATMNHLFYVQSESNSECTIHACHQIIFGNHSFPISHLQETNLFFTALNCITHNCQWKSFIVQCCINFHLFQHLSLWRLKLVWMHCTIFHSESYDAEKGQSRVKTTAPNLKLHEKSRFHRAGF